MSPLHNRLDEGCSFLRVELGRSWNRAHIDDNQMCTFAFLVLDPSLSMVTFYLSQLAVFSASFLLPEPGESLHSNRFQNIPWHQSSAKVRLRVLPVLEVCGSGEGPGPTGIP